MPYTKSINTACELTYTLELGVVFYIINERCFTGRQWLGSFLSTSLKDANPEAGRDWHVSNGIC